MHGMHPEDWFTLVDLFNAFGTQMLYIPIQRTYICLFPGIIGALESAWTPLSLVSAIVVYSSIV